MRNRLYKSFVSISLLLVFVQMLMVKSLHTHADDQSVQHSCQCTTQKHQETPSDIPSEHKDNESHCHICDYIISPFLENTPPFFTLYTSFITALGDRLVQDCLCISVVYKNTRAPPFLSLV